MSKQNKTLPTFPPMAQAAIADDPAHFAIAGGMLRA